MSSEDVLYNMTTAFKIYSYVKYYLFPLSFNNLVFNFIFSSYHLIHIHYFPLEFPCLISNLLSMMEEKNMVTFLFLNPIFSNHQMLSLVSLAQYIKSIFGALNIKDISSFS